MTKAKHTPEQIKYMLECTSREAIVYSAAPELLDALEKMVKEFEVDEIDGGTRYQAELCYDAKMAIKKARGL